MLAPRSDFQTGE